MPSRSPTRDINYLSKDFESIKTDLIDYVKRHFPSDWRDFNDASGGMALLELMAYVGDVLSFNIDRQVNEAYINRAVETKNIVSLAQNFGYTPKNTTPAVVNLSISANMADSTSGETLFVLKKGATVFTNFEPIVSFETLSDVNFTQAKDRIINTVGGTTTVTVSGVSAAAGISKVFEYTANEAIKFLKITLPDSDINEIVSVSAADGSEYFQVNSLAIDTIFTGEVNTDSSSGDAAYIMRLRRVPKRYVVEREPTGLTSIRFGPGVLMEEDSEIIPNPNDFVLPPTLRGSPSGFAPAAIDSTNFLKTKSLGVAPQNTILTINYRAGGGVATNVGVKTLNRFINKQVEFAKPNLTSISAVTTTDIYDSISCTNYEQASGGEEAESIVSIRENSMNNMASQMRCVTLQDYQARIMAMPSQFGTVFRSFVRKDPNNSLGVQLFLITRNSIGNLTIPSGVVKNNIESYIGKFRSFSDTVKISPGRIVNISVQFTIVPQADANGQEAMMECILLLQRIFETARTNFNDTIVIPDAQARLQSLQKIMSVPNLIINNRVGTVSGRGYSGTEFDINANTNSGIIKFPQDVAWELKYPNFDITGRTADQSTAAAQGGGGGGY
tara:strand:+ start:2513 stop:4354 length:1842 start_codon:yes stop_codon:yes gene_type:complete